MNTPNEILGNLQIHQLGYLVLRIVWPEALANMRRAVIWCTLDSPEKVLQLFLIASFLSSFWFFSLFFLNSNNKRTKTKISICIIPQRKNSNAIPPLCLYCFRCHLQKTRHKKQTNCTFTPRFDYHLFTSWHQLECFNCPGDLNTISFRIRKYNISS